MRSIPEWLQGLGLGKYVRLFEENEIDFESLPHLTDALLTEMGLPIGPRAKLLASIRDLAARAAIVDATSDDPTKARPAVGLRGERRQVTVMFCDLVDSTALAGLFDPEDFGALIQAYQKASGTVIERYEGHISQYRGDGIEVLFGWPAAQEDAAERAVRAALEVVEAVKSVPSPRQLSVRIGIATGMVVTGLDDPSTPSGVVGEALHIAARLQNVASPDSVVIAETTSRLVSAWFDQHDLGLQTLKGVLEPIRIFRVSGVRPDTTRFHAARAAAITPLIGRRTEIGFLMERWRDAIAGDGQAVFVSGVPGIGKSRIVYEMGKLIGGEDPFTLSFQCLPHCMQSPLFPVIQHLERLAGFAPDDSSQAKLEKIEKLIACTADERREAVPFVAEMLSIRLQSRPIPPELSPAQVRNQTLFILADLLLALAKKRPVFCVFEDAQWIDPSTQELLDLFLSMIENGRILLVVTHRPEYRFAASRYGNVSTLTITRLGRHDVAEMARLALGDQEVSLEVIKKIIDESDSIPLFVEELVRGTVEPGNQHIAGHPPALIAPALVPDSLRDSLVARLDRAPQARSVAQVAAVIGREFSYDMLLRVSSLPGSELDSTLAHLKQSDIVQLVDNRPPARYAFKHALLRDAAYETLLRSTRREIHARVAAVLECEWPDVVAGQPELLAYHYSLAGKAEFAVRHWILGGRRARSRSANLEAIVQFQKALELIELIPETPERVLMELEIHLSLGLCSIGVHGYSADQTRIAFERASNLSAETREPQKEMQALFGLWGHYWMRARHDRAIELAEKLLAKADELEDPVAAIVAHRSLGSTLFTRGDFLPARHHLERAAGLGQQSKIDKSSSSLAYAVDPRIAARLMLAWDLWILGYPEQARTSAIQALEQATELGDPYTIAFAHYVKSAVHLLRGDIEDSLAHANRSLAVSTEHRINLYALYSRFGRGCALARAGQQEAAIADIQAGIEAARQSNLGYMRGFMLGWLATAQVDSEDPDAALSTIDEALRQTDDVTGRAWEAELRRLRGDVLLLAHPQATAEAERNFAEAASIARHQQARSLELRAVASWTRLLRRQGRPDEAREALSRTFEWFSEGFNTVDLGDAKALLDELQKH